MSNAKIASKSKEIKFFNVNGKKVVPVKFVSQDRSFMAAIYKDSLKIVKGENGEILTWSQIVSM